VTRLSSFQDQYYPRERTLLANRVSNPEVVVIVAASEAAIAVVSVVEIEVASEEAQEVASVEATEAASEAATEVASAVHQEVVSEPLDNRRIN